MDADFDGEEAAVLEEGGRVCHEAAVEVEAVLAAGERGARLFEPDFGREGGDVAVRDVGRVGEDGVVALARERREQVAGVEGDAVRDFERGGVFLSDGARGRADVDGVGLRLGQEMEDGKADGTGACADVGKGNRFCSPSPRRRSTAACTRISVSGRGTRVSAVTLKVSPMNSFSPSR